MKLINTEKAPGAIGPYSQGFEVNGIVYTSGQIPVNPADGNCISLKMLAVTGNDLIKAGMKPGKEVGQTLHHFLELVLEEPEKNSREYLLGMLKV